MDFLFDYFPSIGIDFWNFLIFSGVLILATLLLGTFARVVFGRNSTLCHSLSGAIGILFIYAITVVIHSIGVEYKYLTTPLPFVSISGQTMSLFSFQGAPYTLVGEQLLSMIILAFLANLATGWLPKGKNIFTWVIFRSLAIVIAMALHLGVHWLSLTFLPEGIVTYAPVILLALLVIMLLTGALKFLVGLLLTSVNPLIAAFYTFFFANVVGKQLTRAVFTTALLAGLSYGMQSLGIVGVSISTAALSAYLPFAILLAVLWYVLERVF